MSRYTLTHTYSHTVPSAAAGSSKNLISTKPNNGRSNITDVICLQTVATDCVCVLSHVCGYYNFRKTGSNWTGIVQLIHVTPWHKENYILQPSLCKKAV